MFAIVTPHDGKTISQYKTKEEAEKKARVSNIFKVIEMPAINPLDNTTRSGV